jgi:glycine/D-amino acid oxidase-like deaminating enzyme
MKVAVFGTGMVGQAIAGTLASLGHTVVVGTRDVESAKGRAGGRRSASGWARVTDLGDLSGARAMEMYLALWLQLMMQIGPMFNNKIVR